MKSPLKFYRFRPVLLTALEFVRTMVDVLVGLDTSKEWTTLPAW